LSRRLRTDVNPNSNPILIMILILTLTRILTATVAVAVIVTLIPMLTPTQFFRVLLGGGCTCHEGYGQTETTGATSMTTIDDLSLGNVGGPFPCCEIRLVDVPDMGYLQSDLLHDDHIPCQGITLTPTLTPTLTL
jgi:acyl-CoA synthetase (AMP-forming)/AMP-acid ligase II